MCIKTIDVDLYHNVLGKIKKNGNIPIPKSPISITNPHEFHERSHMHSKLETWFAVSLRI